LRKHTHAYTCAYTTHARAHAGRVHMHVHMRVTHPSMTLHKFSAVGMRSSFIYNRSHSSFIYDRTYLIHIQKILFLTQMPQDSFDSYTQISFLTQTELIPHSHRTHSSLKQNSFDSYIQDLIPFSNKTRLIWFIWVMTPMLTHPSPMWHMTYPVCIWDIIHSSLIHERTHFIHMSHDSDAHPPLIHMTYKSSRTYTGHDSFLTILGWTHFIHMRGMTSKPIPLSYYVHPYVPWLIRTCHDSSTFAMTHWYCYQRESSY